MNVNEPQIARSHSLKSLYPEYVVSLRHLLYSTDYIFPVESSPFDFFPGTLSGTGVTRDEFPSLATM